MVLLHLLFVALLVGTNVFFTALAVLEVRHAAAAAEEYRAWLATTLDVENPAGLLHHHRANLGVTQLNTWVVLGWLLVVLYSGLFADLVVALDATGWSFVVQGLVFFAVVSVGFRLVRLPFAAYRSFVVERTFGRSRQSARSWVVDAAIGLVLTLVLTVVLGGVFLVALRRLPELWWVAASVVAVGFKLVMQVLYPLVVAPLFNDFEPLEAGELREAVADVVERAGVTCSEILVMDASKRSTYSNAYFVGVCGAKRIVLYDTLVEHLERDELLGVLAHELAHLKAGHVYRKLAVSAVRIGVLAAALYYFVSADWVYAAWGLPRDATYAAVLVGGLWTYPLARFTKPVENYVSVRHEREADAYVVELLGEAEPFAAALRTLVRRNLTNPFPHPYYVLFHHAHPPVPDRLDRLGRASDGGGAVDAGAVGDGGAAGADGAGGAAGADGAIED